MDHQKKHIIQHQPQHIHLQVLQQRHQDIGHVHNLVMVMQLLAVKVPMAQFIVLDLMVNHAIDIQISNCVFVTSYNDEISDLLQKLKARTLT